MSLHKNPIIYEINAWVWLSALGRRYGKFFTLDSVPETVWEGFADLGVDAVWFMGVWERSPAGVRIARRNETLTAEFKRLLPAFSEQDIVGSPYCVHRYVVDGHLGGPEGLACARERLASRGIGLILDFVPNHVAPDHPWVAFHPEFLIQGDSEDMNRDPAAFIAMGDRILACGRDPNLPPWPDVLQLNVFNPGLRQAITETVLDIAGQCDGLRCDMAMLVMNDIFERTWKGLAGTRPSTDYWPALIQSVRKDHPRFLFMAEAYWDLEWRLQQQGFDLCYDQRLRDRLFHGSAERLRQHLNADQAYQERLVRYVENHDEPRVAAALPPEKARAAALVAATVPGARLFHEGQFEGMQIRLPLFLGRRPDEPPDDDTRTFYHRLLKVLHLSCLRDGHWYPCGRSGWPDNRSYENLLAWFWQTDDEGCLIVVNFSDADAQGMIRLPGKSRNDSSWHSRDLLTDQTYEHHGDEINERGVFVNLPRWGCHAFYCGRTGTDALNALLSKLS